MSASDEVLFDWARGERRREVARVAVVGAVGAVVFTLLVVGVVVCS